MRGLLVAHLVVVGAARRVHPLRHVGGVALRTGQAGRQAGGREAGRHAGRGEAGRELR